MTAPRRISLGDAIAIAALVLSGISLWLSFSTNRIANAPNVSISALPARVALICDTLIGEFQTLAVIPVRLANAGGRGTSLLTLRALEDIDDPVNATHTSGARRPIRAHFYLLDSLPRNRGGFEMWGRPLDSLMTSSTVLQIDETDIPRSQPTLIDTSIPAGETRILPIGFRSPFSDSAGQVVEYELSLEAELATTERISLTTRFRAPFLGRGGWCRGRPS